MEQTSLTALAVKKLQIQTGAYSASPTAPPLDHQLNISVVATSIEATAAALKKAGALANRLGARIFLTVPQVVPFPLQLESPPVLVEFNENRYRAIASQMPVETSVDIYLCRDRLSTLRAVLKPRSVVVLGGRKRWWPTSERRLARKLRNDGHEVILIETE